MKISKPYLMTIAIMLIPYDSYSRTPEYKLDTSKPISEKVVIFISPTSEKIKTLKERDGDSFYDIADDVNYYNAKAEEYLEKNKIPYKLTKEMKLVFLVGNKPTEYDYSKSEAAWFIIIYNGKNTPKKGFSIDIEDHAKLLK